MIETIFQQLVFSGFAIALIFSALMVVISRNSVRSALFLVLAFFASAGLWLMLEVEFLGLVLILVYVGAVMTLFLFVVMTLNIDREPKEEGFVRYLPYGIVIVILLTALTLYAISPKHFLLGTKMGITHPANYSNVRALGDILYTEYAYPFEIAGSLLLVAIIAAITLTFRGQQQGNKSIPPQQQITIRREDRIKLVKMQAEKKHDNKSES